MLLFRLLALTAVLAAATSDDPDPCPAGEYPCDVGCIALSLRCCMHPAAISAWTCDDGWECGGPPDWGCKRPRKPVVTETTTIIVTTTRVTAKLPPSSTLTVTPSSSYQGGGTYNPTFTFSVPPPPQETSASDGKGTFYSMPTTTLTRRETCFFDMAAAGQQAGGESGTVTPCPPGLTSSSTVNDGTSGSGAEAVLEGWSVAALAGMTVLVLVGGLV